MKSFSLGNAFQFAWEKFSKHAGFFIGFTVIVLVVSLLISFVPELAVLVRLDPLSVLVLTLLLPPIVGVFLGVWTTRVSIETVDGHTPNFSNIVPSWDVFWKYLVSGLLVTLIVSIPAVIGFSILGIGLLSVLFGGEASTSFNFASAVTPLLIALALVPVFIYLSVRLLFASYLVVDRKIGPIDSVSMSFALTKGVFWKVFLFTIVFSALNFVGAIPLGLGLFITLPMTLIATAYIYRELSKAVLPPLPDAEVPTPGIAVPSPEDPREEVPPTPDL